MEIGQVFEFNSNGTIRKAIFKEEVDGKIVCILYGERTTQGTEITIQKSLIIN
jgi:hypothetical protein